VSTPRNSSTDPGQKAGVRLRITGRVQGVGFRFSAIDAARRLALTGWVRNTYDGDVELVAEGDKDGLQRLITWCHAGPPGALVTHVETTWLPYSGGFDAFRLRH
jgi:acylphosphatase